jgi:adenylate kinase family enzyme
MLATSLDINAELLARVFALDLYPGLIIQPENDMTIRPHVTLLLGDPNVIRGLELTRLTKHTNTMLINGLKLREAAATVSSSSSSNQMTAQEYISLLRNTIHKYSSSSSSSSSSSPKGFVITDCPRNEHDARALLAAIREHRLNIDTVIEIETLEDDEHEDLLLQGDHDVVGEYLDAIELLRDPFTSLDSSLPNNEFLQLHIQWKKIEDDAGGGGGGGGGGRSISKLTDILIHEVKSILKIYIEENEELMRANQSGPVTNAFAISLFCLDEKYESRSEDLIRVAFEEYPEKDYCILMIPNTRIPSQALVHCMQCPLLRDGVSFDQSLYLIHREALLAHDLLTIERIQDLNRTITTTKGNDHSFQNVLEPFVDYLDIQDYNEMMNSITRSIRDKDVELSNNPAEVSFQIILNDEIVGIICLSRKLTTTEDINSLRESYLLDERVSYERHRSRSQAMITHFILNPIFYKWVRYIYREVMRFYHKTVLYYQGTKGIQPAIPIVEEMIPIQIRKKSMQYEISTAPGGGGEEEKGEGKESGSGRDKKRRGKQQQQQQSDLNNTVECNRPLFVITKKDISIKKEIIGKRIVIIGGNTTAFKILESLCFVNEKHLNNIYLVMESSPSAWNYSSYPNEDEGGEGGGGEGGAGAGADEELVKMIRDNYSGCLSPKDIDDYTEDEIFALGLPNRVTLIQGKLTDIDRKNRAVIISDEAIVEYDVLVLAAGCQGIASSSLSSPPHPLTLIP